jgi:hypothetical protein
MSTLSKDGKRKRKQRLKGQFRSTLEQVMLQKNDDPVPQDVIKAAANVSGVSLSYNQGYHAIKSFIEKVM